MNPKKFQLIASELKITGISEELIKVEFYLSSQNKNGLPQFVFFAHAVLWRGGVFELPENQVVLLRHIYESKDGRVTHKSLQKLLWETPVDDIANSIHQLVHRLNDNLTANGVPLRILTDNGIVWAIVPS